MTALSATGKYTRDTLHGEDHARNTKGKNIEGQPLFMLESMRMEHAITAPCGGIVCEIGAEGSLIFRGTILVRLAEN